jgi:hypothetical protein
MVPGGRHLGQSQTTQAELAAAEKLEFRKHEAITCGQGIEECTCRSARDTVSLGLVVGGSDLNAEGMVLGVDRNVTGGFEGVENVWQDFEGNILWVGYVWGAEAGRVGKAAVPKAFNFRAFTGNRPEHCSTFSQCTVIACSHEQSRCCDPFWGGVIPARTSFAPRRPEGLLEAVPGHRQLVMVEFALQRVMQDDAFGLCRCMKGSGPSMRAVAWWA